MKRTLLPLICCFVLVPKPGFAYYCTKGNYIPPEIVHAHALHDRVVVPKAINLNTASLAELENLPGITQSIALKLMRLRPLKGLRDLYHLPWEESKTVDRLIQSIEPVSSF